MAIRQIRKTGDLILKKTCRNIEKFDDKLKELIEDMKETMKDANGIGLAACQVGIMRRCIVADLGEEKGIVAMVNPKIIEKKGEEHGIEGCLSFPNEHAVTVRPEYVKVKAFDADGNNIIVEGEKLQARILCHEIDHLDGITFKDRAVYILNENDLKDFNYEEFMKRKEEENWK